MPGPGGFPNRLHFFCNRLAGSGVIPRKAMIRNYLKTAIRNIWRHKGHALINVLGLALSMSVCLLIILVIMDQTSYDNFHENKQRIYRVTTEDHNFEFSIDRFATSPPVLGKELESRYPQVKQVATIHRSAAGELEKDGKVLDLVGLTADEAFFDVFSFPLLGEGSSALTEPNTIVIREQTAGKFFGSENPVGKTLHSEAFGELTISGVIPDTKEKTHIRFDYLLSSVSLDTISNSWLEAYDSYNYLLLADQSDLSGLKKGMTRLANEHYSDKADHDFSFHLQKLGDIAPGPLMGNEIGFYLPDFMIYVLAILAFIVIFSAAVNYTNLSIARSLTRVKEVGMRKVVGARRKQVIGQFLVESVLMALIALVFAYGMLQYLKPAFHDLQLMSLLEIDPRENAGVYLAFLLFAVLVGVVAGLSPSWIMSRFRPAHILKGLSGTRKILSGQGMRKSLIVTQFVVSIVLIISIILVYRQSDYFLNSNHGFRQSGVLNIRLQENSREKVSQWLASYPSVEDFAYSAVIPGLGNRHSSEAWKGDEEKSFNLNHIKVDARYVDVMNLNLIAGSSFPEDASTENEKFLIINEQAVSQFGFDTPASAPGQYVTVEDSLNLEILGVIEDFHFVSKFERIKPFALRLKPDQTHYVQAVIAGPSLKGTYDKLKEDWKQIDERHPFEAEWMDQEIEDYYMMLGEMMYIVGYVTLLALAVACLGLLGMAAYSVQVRRKEIGIRKAMGANTQSIVGTLSRSFVRILMVATLIALPLAYYGNNIWLSSFAYRVDFGWATLAAGTLLVLSISLAIVFYQALRASRNNPAHVLRYE